MYKIIYKSYLSVLVFPEVVRENDWQNKVNK